MKRTLFLIVPALAGLAIWTMSSRPTTPAAVPPPTVGELSTGAPAVDVDLPLDPDQPMAGPDRERWFFDDWHGKDHGAVLDRQTLDNIWGQIHALQTPVSRAGAQWDLVGASGMVTDNGALYSGRILDIESVVNPGTGGILVWLAAASGGLWEYDDLTQAVTPLTDGLVTQAVGTVSVDPANVNNLVIGTGEWGVRAGSGVFRSTDGGSTWAQSTESSGGIFHRIRHVTSSLVLGISNAGTHRSTDGGATWSWRTSGIHFDLSLDPTNANKAHTTFTSAGNAWTVMTTDGGITWGAPPGAVATTGLRGAISVAPSNANIVYAAFSENAPSYVLDGVYKSTDGGNSWAVSLPGAGNNYMGGQGWYNNVISVHPTDANTVYAAGTPWKRTTDGGASWLDVDSSDSNHMHVDFHSMDWMTIDVAPNQTQGLTRDVQARGTSIIQLVGHDGGWSFDNGGGYQSFLNYLPITQYTHVHSSTSDLLTLGGGSQDNGISMTTDGGSTWFYRLGGDGSDVSIDPNDSQRIWIVNGVYGGGLAFRRKFSTDQGLTWADTNVGIAGSTDWYTEIANDQVNPVYLYTNAGAFVYQSQDYAATWATFGSFTADVRNVDVGRWSGAAAGVYATLASTTTGNRVWIHDGTSWNQRDAGLPTGVEIRSVIGHPIESSTCYALVNGIGTPGNKVYRSTNLGATWTNITGDLPDVPLGGIVAHPTDPTKIYLGTEMGCFETANGGTNWQTWNTGMPTAAIVADMTYVDQLASHGHFYVIAGTYGRSMYRREISGFEPTAVAELAASEARVQLAQNTPNPHRGDTRISYSLPKAGRVKLAVYDVSGRQVATLVDEVMPAGAHEAEFRSDTLAPGAYFYRLETSGKPLSRKMIVIR